MINDGTENLEIGNIFISVKNESGKITVVKIYIGKATATGGTSKSATNLNTNSTNTPEVTLIENNPTITGTDSKILELYFQLQDTQIVPFDGGMCLTKDGSLRATCTGATGAVGTYTCDVSFQFWQERDI